MARRVFFSFHYNRDAWRVSQIRNSNIVTQKYEKSPFLDKAGWESIKRQGGTAVRAWIDRQLNGSGVTIVLIGRETSNRPFVKYEIERSVAAGKGLLGIRIHSMLDQNGSRDQPGDNPFTKLGLRDISVYDWISDAGRQNVSSWIEAAANQVGR